MNQQQPGVAWYTVRRAIREMIALPYEEHIDTVMVAAFLYSHVETRSQNVWLTLVAPIGDGIFPALISLLLDHPSIHKLPDRWSSNYLFRTSYGKKGAIMEMLGRNQRVMLQSDMRSLTHGILGGRNRHDIYTQLSMLCDGHYKAASRMRTRELAQRDCNQMIGFIGASAPHVYDWVTEGSAGLGERMLFYHVNPMRIDRWIDSRTKQIAQAQRGGRTEYEKMAKDVLHAYLHRAFLRLSRFAAVEMSSADTEKIIAASRLATRMLSVDRAETGQRRAAQVCEMTRMFALMRGRLRVDAEDVEIGVKLALSQMNPKQQGIVAFGMRPGVESWSMLQFCEETGATRDVYRPTFSALIDAGILRGVRSRRQKGVKEWYSFTPEISEIVNTINPERSVYAQPEPVKDEFDTLAGIVEAQ